MHSLGLSCGRMPTPVSRKEVTELARLMVDVESTGKQLETRLHQSIELRNDINILRNDPSLVNNQDKETQEVKRKLDEAAELYDQKIDMEKQTLKEVKGMEDDLEKLIQQELEKERKAREGQQGDLETNHYD